jgi:hypothetical protein
VTDNRVHTALDTILEEEELAEDLSQYYLVSGTVPITIRRSKLTKEDQVVAEYRVRIANRRSTLFQLPWENSLPQSIDAVVDIDLKSARIDFRWEGQSRSKQITSRRLFAYGRNCPSQYTRNCTFIKTAPFPESREIIIGKRTISLPAGERGSLLFRVQEGPQSALFNLRGRMLYPRVALAAALQQRADSYSLERQRRKALNYLLCLWRDKPSSFGHEGRTVVVEGEFSRKVNSSGNVCFMHLVRDQPHSVFWVGKEYCQQEMKVEIKGPYLLFYHGEELVKGYRTPFIGVESRGIEDVSPETEYFRLRPIRPTENYTYCRTGERMYVFDNRRVRRQAQGCGRGLRYALVCHKTDGHATFTLAFRSGTGGIRQKPIRENYSRRI